MAKLITVQYQKCMYPKDIKPNIYEVACHCDKKTLNIRGNYSLHTEYSFMGRKFDSEGIQKYNVICNANKKGIPMLWYSKEWALEFAGFIVEITKGEIPPSVIEIHPPFSDYSDLDVFIDLYKVFDEKIRNYFPDVVILIENRSGTSYSGGKFILSKM